MALQIKFPVADEYGFYEIRFDSIGGLGAHLAGQIMGEAVALKMGLNALHFSSYGSEKKGSPIKSFMRFAQGDKEIRACTPVERPHMVAVFHDALLRTPGLLDGLRDKGTLIINTRKSLEELRAMGVPNNVRLYVIDALGISIEEKSRVNTAIMGAVVQASGFLDPDAVIATINEQFTKKHPNAVEPNKKTFARGMKELKLLAEPASNGEAEKIAPRAKPKFGYLVAPMGGVITEAGSSIMKDLSTSRQGFIPIWHAEKCIHCAMCEMACPDQCIVWEEGKAEAGKPAKAKNKGIDYNYCKGCMRCVVVCPKAALTKEREEEGLAKKLRVAKFPAVRP